MLKKSHSINKCRSARGVTLVEMMMAMMIFLLLSGGVYAALQTGERSWNVNDVRIRMQQELRKAMDGMINDLREAGSSSILNVPANGTWYTSITFQVPTGVTAGSLVWNGNNITFAKGGSGATQLLRTQGAQTSILAQNVQTLQFRRQAASPEELEISMLARRSTINGDPIDYRLDFKVQLRN